MPTILGGLDRIGARFTGTETTEERVSLLASAQADFKKYMMWALTHLDSRNFSEGGLAAITDPIYAKIKDQDGYMAQLALEAQGLALRLSNAEGSVTSLQITANRLAAQIADANGSINSLQITAQGLQTRVTNAEGGISNLTQTVNGFRLEVTNLENFSTIALLAGEMVLSSEKIQISGMVTFSDLSDPESQTRINGGNIDTDTLFLDTLYGRNIYFCDDNDNIAARFDVSDASSYDGGALALYTGAMKIVAGDGDIFLDSLMGYVTLSAADGVTVRSDLYPSKDAYYDLGISSYVWNNLYVASGTINTSDRRKKRAINCDLERYEALFDALRPVSYQMASGTSGRTHIGFVAQDVEDALAASGMTSLDFAGFIRSPILDDQGQETGDYNYALRYAEFVALNTWQIQKLKARVEELERRLAQ